MCIHEYSICYIGFSVRIIQRTYQIERFTSKISRLKKNNSNLFSKTFNSNSEQSYLFVLPRA